MPNYAFVPRFLRDAFLPLKNLLPNRFAKRRVGSGRRPGSSTAASVARFAIKSSGTSIGRRGAAKRPLRLFVLAPTPYRKRKSGRLYYRDPAYLLTTDLRSSVTQLLQIYFDRWQIEVNHREQKDTLGVGQAQLWNVTSVPKQPVLAVASYSALLLASLQAFGAERGNAYAQLPKWRRNARRPSCLDLITLLRKEITQQTPLLDPFALKLSSPELVQAAAA